MRVQQAQSLTCVNLSAWLSAAPIVNYAVPIRRIPLEQA